MFRLELLGGFQLSYQHRFVDISRRPRLQALLAYLALNRHQPQTRATIITALWPDTSESSGRNRLRNLLYQLRQVLPEHDALITIDPTSLKWLTDTDCDLDIAHFEAELALASQQTESLSRELHLARAVELYNGDLVPGCVDEWIEEPRLRLRNQLTDALAELISLAEVRHAWDAAEEYTERLLRHDPLHEATYCRAMQSCARRGELAGVMRIYARCCDVLAQELDVEPSAATQSLYRQLTTLSAPVGSPSADTRRVDKPATLVGRDNEWHALQRLWQQVQNGESRLAVIQGEAGIGKTRLCQDLLDWVKEEHAYVASASCYAVEGTLAFAPAAEWLRTEPFWQSLGSLENEWLVAVARLLPELRGRFKQLSALSQTEDSLQRQHFFTALAVALLEHGQPVLLLVDDLQWADQETLDWLHYLIRYETPTPLLVLATLRTDDAEERARCQPLLRELARHKRLSEIQLRPLSIGDTTVLAQQILGSEPFATYAAQLYHETDGNPFYIVETVRSRPRSFIESDSFLQPDDIGSEIEHYLPPRVRALIEERLARLSPPANEILQLAAVIGRRFDYALLAAATNRNEEVLLQAMEELWAQHIIREASLSQFDFVHDKLRIAAYGQISPVRRQLYHRKIAEALVGEQQKGLGMWDSQIAEHFVQAGLGRQALPYYLEAARTAKKLFANDDAFALLARGIFLLEREPEWEIGKSADMSALHHHLYTALGDMHMLVGAYDLARSAYQTALAQISSDARLSRAIQLRRIGDTKSAQHHYDEALIDYHQVEQLLDVESDGFPPSEGWQHEWVQLQLSLVSLHYGTGENALLENLIRTIEPRVMSLGSLIQRADFLEGVAMLYMRQERYAISDLTLDRQRTALDVWREAGDFAGIANNQFSLAFCHLWRREFREARENIHIARDIASKIGSGRVLTLCATYMSILERFCGNVDKAQHHAAESLHLSERHGIHFYSGMAKANLAWVALRKGDDERAIVIGQEASEIMTVAYPFRWAALWPLLGVAANHANLPRAVDYVRQLLDQRQQRLPDCLAQPLVHALNAWEESDGKLTIHHLRSCTETAIDLGYL